jgi:serine/threonine protein kinase
LVFAATGRRPFAAPSAGAIVYRITSPPPELDKVPAAYREVIAACLAKPPNDRPTAAKLLERLAELDPTPARHCRRP